MRAWQGIIAVTGGGERFEVRVDELLIATGHIPNTERLGLDVVGVRTNSRGAVIIDEQQRASVGSIYAAGDVTTQRHFVYGAAAAQNALSDGTVHRLDFAHLPRVMFMTPRSAPPGSPSTRPAGRGREIETRILGLEAVPRALVNRDTRGLFKLVAKAGSGRLLGASIIAPGAAEVIQSAVLAMVLG